MAASQVVVGVEKATVPPMRITARLAAGLLAAIISTGCGGQQSTAPASGTAAGAAVPPANGVAAGGPGWFEVKSGDVGLSFTHFNGMSGQYYFPEMLPPGVWASTGTEIA